jgi:hypothetical protein
MRTLLSAAVALALFHSFPARSATAPGPDAFGYSVATTTAFSFTQITNGLRVLYFADDEAVTVNIGFSFNFYGVNYTNVSFTPNGLMTFGGASSDCNNTNLSTTVAPSNNLPCIAVLWDDWETQSVGSDGLYYRTVGSIGSRQFIVQWNKVIPVNGPGVDPVTFEARLFEGSNQILFSYLDVVVSDDPSYGNGVFATVGIRDTDGQTNNRNLLWSYNQAVIANGENILFTRQNHAPIAVNDSYDTIRNLPLTLPVANLLTNDVDVDGDALTVTAVSNPGAAGGTVNWTNSLIVYTPPPGFTGTDVFTYSVSDGHGGTASGSVTIHVWPFEVVSITPLAGSGVSLQFAGIPLRTYTVLASSNLVDWINVGMRTADANGRFSFDQASSTPAAFFRAQFSP